MKYKNHHRYSTGDRRHSSTTTYPSEIYGASEESTWAEGCLAENVSLPHSLILYPIHICAV